MNITPDNSKISDSDPFPTDHHFKKIQKPSDVFANVHTFFKKVWSLASDNPQWYMIAKLKQRFSILPSREVPKEILTDITQKKFKLTNKIVYQILGGGVGGNTFLSGSNPQEILGYFTESQTFKESLGPDLQQQLMLCLDTALAKSDPEFISHLVQSKVATKSPFIIASGWVGSPIGHTIYLKVSFTPDGKAHLRLYNVGAHDYAIPSHHKIKIPPFIDWIDIPLENLTNPLTWKGLSEMRNHYFQTHYGPSDLYQSFKDLLSPGHVSIPNDSEIFKTPQGIENCSWKSLAILLADHLSIQDYKKFMIQLALEILENFFPTHPQPTIQDWRLIQKALTKLQYDIYDYQETYHEFPASIDQIQLILNQTKSWLHQNKGIKLTHPSEEKLNPPVKDFKVSHPLVADTITETQIVKYVPPAIHFKPFDLEHLSQFVEELNDGCQNYQDWLVEASMRAFLQKIDLNTFKEGLPKEQKTLEVLSSIYEKLTIIAFRLFIEENCSYTLDQATLMGKLVYIQQALVQTIYGKKWSFGNMIPAFFQPNEYIFQTPEQKGEQKMLLETAQKDYENCFKFVRTSPGNIPMIQSSFAHEPQEIDQFLNNIFAIKSLFKSETIQSHPQIEKAPEGTQNAYFYGSNVMPPAIQSLRNCILYSQFLSQWKRDLDLLKCDRSQDLTWLFEVYEKNDFAVLKCSIQGLQLVQKRSDLNPFIDPEFASLLNDPLEDEINVFKKNSNLSTYKKIMSSNGWALPKFLDHFYHHPTEIEKADVQKLFDAKLFSSEIALLKPQSQLFADLVQWIELTYQTALVNNKIQTSLFMNRLLLQLGCYFSEDLKRQALKQLQDLAKKDFEPKELGSVYYEMLYGFTHLSELTQEQAIALLQASAYLWLYPYKTDSSTPSMDKKIHAVIYQHSISVSQLNLFHKKEGSVNHRILNLIISNVLGLPPNSQTEWKVNQTDKSVFYTESIIYQPLTGEIRARSISQPLPKDFYARFNDFQRAFPVQQNLRFNGVSYLFEDASGETIEIYPHQKGYEIFQKIEGRRYRLLMPDEIKDFCGSHYLNFGYFAWQLIDQPSRIILTPKKSSDPFFHMQLAAVNDQGFYKLNSIQKLRDGLSLMLRPAHFAQFEQREFIHEFVNPDNPDELVEIEFPRFGLAFVSNGAKLMSQNFEGFHLVKQPLRKLGSFRNYLVIANDRGEWKVLIPTHAYQEHQFKEVLVPYYTFKRDLSNLNQQSYYLFDLVNGELQSKDRESNFYLAATFQINQEYAKCQKILRKYEANLTSFSEFETQNLQQIVETKTITGDQSLLAIANSLKAAVILLKNQLFHQKNFTEVSSTVKDIYSRYLRKLKKIGIPFQLDSAEEIFLLKLINADPGSIFQLRLHSLTGLEFTSQQIIRSDSSLVNKTYILDLPMRTAFPNDENYKNFKAELNETSITRAEISKQFFLLYALAKDETIDKKWLTTALNFIINSPRPMEKQLTLALFLREVLIQPEKFPPPPKTDHDKIQFRAKLGYGPYQLKHTKNVQIIPHIFNYKRVFEPKRGIEPFSIPLHFPPTSSTIPAIDHEYFKLMEFSSTEEQFPAYQAWLKEQSAKQTDSSVQKEWQRLEKDSQLFEAATKRKAVPKKTFAEQQTFQGLVQNEIEDLNAINVRQKDHILNLANKGFRSPKEELGRTLWKESQKIKAITLEQLLVNFGQQRPEKLLELNPALTPWDIQTLYQELGFFLVNSIESQRLDRLDRTLHQLTEDNFRSDEALLEELAEHLKPSSYDPKDHPVLLVFEYFSNMRLRPAQIEKLNLFLEANDDSFVVELIMGAGKSKVLLPLLAALRATNDDLSILILPESLYESIGQDTQNTVSTILGSSLHSFHFDNQTPLTVPYLEALLDEMHLAKDRQEPLICTEKTLSALLLKFIELSYQPTTPEASLLREIISLLTLKGKPLIDEADSILNVIKELMFQQGSIKGVDSDEIHLICAIYQTFYTHPTAKSAFKLESDPFADPRAPSLTPSLFREHSAHMAKLIFQKIVQQEWSTPEKTQEIQAFFRRLIDEARSMDDALSYVCRLEDSAERGQNFYNRQSATIRNMLALVGQELSSFLPINLLRNHNEKYGFDKTDQNLFAIPYKSADTPALSSEFSNTHITINYTIQSYLKEGIKKEMLKDYIKNLQNKALNEMKIQNLKEASILKTQAWKEFCTFRSDLGIPFFNYTEKNLDQLLNTINQSASLMIDFVRNHVLSSLATSEKRMSSNPLLFAALFKQVSGLTGTLWNASSMHSKLKAEKASGIESKTLFLLWKNSSESILEIQEGSTSEMLAQLPPFDLLTDAGAYFKDESNAKMAELISEKYHTSVMYYNHEGLITQTDPNPTQTYLDQNHSVGADTKQNIDAVGLVTIGKEMLLRDLLQSVWRLRGLDKNQKVQLVVSHEIANLIRDELKLSADTRIGLKEIISYTVQNQVRRYREDNVKALGLELDSLLQIQVLHLLLDATFASKYPQQVKKMIDEFWIQEMESTPSERYGNLPAEVSLSNYLKAQWKFYKKKAQSLAKMVPEEIPFDRMLLEQEIKQVIQRYQPSLPESMLKANSEIDDTVETTAVAYQETETTTVSEVNIDQASGVTYGRIKGQRLESIEQFDASDISQAVELTPYFALNNYFAAFEDFRDYSQEFNGIDITANMLLWKVKSTNPKDYHFFGSHRVDPHFVLIRDDKVILLSDRDVNRNKASPNLYHIGIGFCNKKQELTAEQKLQLVKIKFLKGEVRYDKEEIELLKTWLGSDKKIKSLEVFFKSNILEYSPEIRKDYRGSVLEKLFQNSTSNE